MKLAYLIRGLPGHPSHPPLTDATIGAYAFAVVAAVLSALGVAEQNAAKAWSLAIVVALVLTAPTALTGLADWLTIRRGTPLWRTATLHLAANVSAAAVFLVAAIVGYADAADGVVTGGALALSLVGFGLLTVGGWLGGAIVFVHGMRVLSLAEEPTHRAVAPAPTPEKEAASRP